MKDFVDQHRDTFGVEPICKVLQISPSGYRRYAAQKRDPSLRRAPWKTKESLELATLQWVHCFNHQRLLGSIGHIPPAEAEANYYLQLAQ